MPRIRVRVRVYSHRIRKLLKLNSHHWELENSVEVMYSLNNCKLFWKGTQIIGKYSHY